MVPSLDAGQTALMTAQSAVREIMRILKFYLFLIRKKHTVTTFAS